LIAEEVAQANPDLAVRDKDGEIYTVRYDAGDLITNEAMQPAAGRCESPLPVPETHSAFIRAQNKALSLVAVCINDEVM
jgi:hypothetical protein